MIDAKDLMLGNYLMITHTREVFQVLREHLADEDEEVLSESEPVPLTKKSLVEKFGFIKDKVDNTCYKGDFEILLPNYFKWKDSHLEVIKYEHDLQNIYKSFTRKNLKTK